MNMSTKEIAEIRNISVGGVELALSTPKKAWLE